MHLLLLAIIHAKYNGRFEGAFVGAFFLDLAWCAAFVFLFQMFYKG